MWQVRRLDPKRECPFFVTFFQNQYGYMRSKGCNPWVLADFKLLFLTFIYFPSLKLVGVVSDYFDGPDWLYLSICTYFSWKHILSNCILLSDDYTVTFYCFILGKPILRSSKFDDIESWNQQKKDSRMFLLFIQIEWNYPLPISVLRCLSDLPKTKCANMNFES